MLKGRTPSIDSMSLQRSTPLNFEEDNLQWDRETRKTKSDLSCLFTQWLLTLQ